MAMPGMRFPRPAYRAARCPSQRHPRSENLAGERGAGTSNTPARRGSVMRRGWRLVVLGGLLPQRDQKMLTTNEDRSIRYRRRGHDVIVQRVYRKQFKDGAGLDNTGFPLLGGEVKSPIRRDGRRRIADR